MLCFVIISPPSVSTAPGVKTTPTHPLGSAIFGVDPAIFFLIMMGDSARSELPGLSVLGNGGASVLGWSVVRCWLVEGRGGERV